MIFKNFLKIQQTKKFTYEPRYFDPVKEELDARIKSIEAQVKAEKEGKQIDEDNYSYRISHAFRSQRTQPKSIFDFSSNLAFVRLLIVFLLSITLYSWLEYGDQLFELFSNSRNVMLLGLLVISYIFYKFRFSKRP